MSTTLAGNRLGALSVAGFALTAAAPMLVVGGVVPTGWAVTGTVAVSVAMLVIAAVLAVFCVGYVTMARHVANAGSLYTYVAHGFGPVAAVAAAFVQLLAYSMMQVALYGIGGVQAEAVLGDLLGVDAPWWVWALGAWVAVTVLGTRGVGVSSRILAVAVAAELVLVVIVAGIDLAHPAGGTVSFAALDPGGLDLSTFGVVLAIGVTAFIGVEAAPVYSEESRRPRSTVLTATFVALGLMTVAYVLVSWAMTVTVGPERVVAVAGELGPDMLLVPAAAHVGGDLLVDAGHVLLLTSIAAGMLAYHNAVARCAFALGRERVLPGVFGRTSPRSGAPIAASLAQSVCGLIVVIVVAVAGWDPMTRLFFALGTTGALGVFTLITAASASVVGFFGRDRRGEGLWATRLLPGVATAALVGCVGLIVANYTTLIGVGADSPARWVPGVFVVAGGLGCGYGWWLRAARRGVLARVGHGANAALLPTEAPAAPVEVA
ncbi:MAG: APC family permease [Dactylosporangium sp.]|nr:APC family permease [Dactylosporangium sp.]NNJ59906.1 APC family permease [Dactylosporangium sp.]